MDQALNSQAEAQGERQAQGAGRPVQLVSGGAGAHEAKPGGLFGTLPLVLQMSIAEQLNYDTLKSLR